MRGFLLLVVLGLGGLVALGRALKPALPVSATEAERGCDGRCGRMVHPARAHTHHHEPGCGTSPTAAPCSCSYFLCADCCPCAIAGLVVTDRPGGAAPVGPAPVHASSSHGHAGTMPHPDSLDFGDRR